MWKSGKSGKSLQALSSMLASKEEALPQEMLPEVATCLLDLLAAHCSSGSALPLDRPFSRLFYTLLRTLQAVVSQASIFRPSVPTNGHWIVHDKAHGTTGLSQQAARPNRCRGSSLR